MILAPRRENTATHTGHRRRLSKEVWPGRVSAGLSTNIIGVYLSLSCRQPMRVFVLLAALLVATPAVSQSVSMRDGNLFYRASANAAPRQLTRTGLDRDAVLSPDGRTVAFIRGTPGEQVETATGEAEATSLWTIGVDGSGARMLLKGRASDHPEQLLAQLQSPRFSPDGRRIYFLSAGWVTSGAVHVLDLSTGSERFLVAGNSLDVVPSGHYARHLVVSQHRYFLAGGSYDWFWLFAPDGREVGPIGENQSALDGFRAMYVQSEAP
jgi:hypothetical protein